VPGYEILGELGRGGMGVVYKARQTHLGRLVALKMILAGGHASPSDLNRFRTEAQAIARLQHPNIVAVHEVGEHEGRPFFSLEFCSGGSLDAQLDGTPLTACRAAALVQTLAQAMHVAHQAQVIHRDLKPANVLLAEDGTPKITDFGLARKLDDQGQTQSGSIMGTPSYMAPEQAEGKSKEMGPACDIYSLGAILYELLTGRPPFKAATPLDTVLQVVANEPVPPTQLQSKAPRDLETICLKCLEKNPSKRYASARDLADDLGRFLAGEPIQARPVGRLERAGKWVRRNPVVAGLLATVVLVLVGAATVSGLFGWAALRQAERADLQAQRADAKANEAEVNARTAGAREKEALEQKRRAEVQRERAEWSVYAGKLELAQSEWRDNNPQGALDALNECQWNLRGWEHRHLWTQFHSNQHTLEGHHQGVMSVAVSADGSRIISGGEDGMLKVWDVARGREILSFRGHQWWAATVAFSPDGSRIASGGRDGQLAVWDAAQVRRIFSVPGHMNAVWSLAFSPDGSRIASGGGDGLVKVWDTAGNRPIFFLPGHAREVWSVAFGPDGSRIASGGSDGLIMVWDAAGGQQIRSSRSHTGRVESVAFSPDGRRIVSGGEDGLVKVWDAATGKELLSLRGHTAFVSSVAFSPDGSRIASGGNGLVKVWDATTGKELLSHKGCTQGVSRVVFSPEGSRIVSGSRDGLVRIWNATRDQEALSLRGHMARVTSVALSPDGSGIVSGGNDDLVKVWDVARGQQVFSLKGHTRWVTSVAVSPDGTRLASGGGDGLVKVWNAAAGKELFSFVGSRTGVASVAFSPDGTRLVSGGSDGLVKVWDAVRNREVFSFKGYAKLTPGLTFSVVFSPDGSRIASAGMDHLVKVWNAATGKELHSLQGHKAFVAGLAFSPDGSRIASAGRDDAVKVWDAVKGMEILSLKGHTRFLSSVAFNSDGTRIVAGSADGVAIWDAVSGQEVFFCRELPVNCVVFSRDDNRLVFGSHDQVKVWDAVSSQTVNWLKGQVGGAASVGFSPDGSVIVSEDRRGERLAWNTTTGQPVDPGNLTLPNNQRAARHIGKNLQVRCDSGKILVQPLEAANRAAEADALLNPDLVPWHDEQARRAEHNREWLAAAFHLERLHRLQPGAGIRARLATALGQTQDSPASRTIHQRFVAFDLARKTAAVGQSGLPATHLTALAVLADTASPIPKPAPLPPEPPQAPPRMPRAD
jgi:WD40 repeat protein